MDKILLAPPIAFIIILGSITLLAAMLSKISQTPKEDVKDQEKSYACGEDVQTHLMQPDYSQFFPFAFFFTVLHVVALMISTVPVETMNSFAIAIIYIAGAMAGLVILFRR